MNFFFWLQYMCDGSGTKCSLSFAANAQDGSLGQKSFHTHITKTFGDAKASIQIWYDSYSVSNILFLVFSQKFAWHEPSFFFTELL